MLSKLRQYFVFDSILKRFIKKIRIFTDAISRASVWTLYIICHITNAIWYCLSSPKKH